MSDCSRRVKILIVDDEPDTVETVHAMLQGRGFDLVHAYDGNQALQVADRETPDLILLDILMPEQDGWLVCAKLKAIEPAPKIVIFTALVQGESDRFADFVHADDIIHKPFSQSELLAKVEQALRNHPTEA